MGYNHFRYARRIDANAIELMHEDLTRLLKITNAKAVNTISLEGLEATGKGLEFYANGTDMIYHRIAEDSIYSCGGGGNHYFRQNNVNFLNLTESGTDEVIQGLTTNNDIAIVPNGAGVLKFGAYNAGVAGDSTGYITIKDGAGNTRKLMVQA